MAKNKRKQVQKGANIKKEIHFVPTAPRRQNFDIQHWRNAIKQAEDVRYPNRIALYDIYKDILLDGHLISVIEQRENALLNNNIEFAKNNGRENEAINDLIQLPWFEEFILEIFRSKLWGYSLLWVDISGGMFNDFESLNRKHIIPEQGVFVKRQYDRNGIKYLEQPYNHYTIPVGFKKNYGRLLEAVPWVLLKRGDISDWASFNEIFANPIRKGSYPMYNDDAKMALMEGLRDMGAFGTVIHPKDTDLEFLIANAAGSADTYSKLAHVCDMQLSKLIVGQTMTTDNGSSHSQAEVHLEIAKQYTARDRRLVINTLNTSFAQLLKWHGFNPDGGMFKYVEEVDLENLKARFNIDKELSNKIEYPPEYFYETYNVPIPKGGAAFKSTHAERTEIPKPKEDNKSSRFRRFFA